MKDTCPKCRQVTKLTKHHILVRRFYGSPPDAPILLICRTCHTELEKLIPEKEKRSARFYWEIIFVFLQANRVRIITWSGDRKYTVRRPDEMSEVQDTNLQRI